MDEELRKLTKMYYVFCLIAGVIVSFYYLCFFDRFSDARIYFGAKPYMFGVNPSYLFSDIIGWFGPAGAGMAWVGITYLLSVRKELWHRSQSRKVAWIATLGGLTILLYGGYKLFKYHGKELYLDIDPILDSAGQTYTIDAFLYMPLVALAVVVLWGALLLWRLYRIKEDNEFSGAAACFQSQSED